MFLGASYGRGKEGANVKFGDADNINTLFLLLNFCRIQSIQINNFKSVADLKLDLGRFNVLIGENGCGESNILEAIAFGAAVSEEVTFESFGSRGIRKTDPQFIFSAFHYITIDNCISLEFNFDGKVATSFECDIKYTNEICDWIFNEKSFGFKPQVFLISFRY